MSLAPDAEPRRARPALLRIVLLIAALLGLRAAPALAQAAAARPGNLRVTVRDATNLPIPGAQVSAFDGSGSEHRGLTNERGTADLEALPPGTYTIRVESPGFDPLTIGAVSVRSGARVSREVELKIAGFVDQVDVLPVESDREMDRAFATDLTAGEILALPEDPDELALVLAQLVGDDAEIRVDGFLDAALPPGTQIQSVRIRYDAASASSSGSGPRIEIRTQPGGDRWRTNASVRIRDEELNARNAFAPTRPIGQSRNYSWTLSGPVVKNRTGMSLTVDRSDGVDQQTIRAATAGGLVAESIQPPNSHLAFSGRIEHGLTPAQRLRIEFRTTDDRSSSQGLGEFDLRERGFTRRWQEGELRVGHNATLSGQMVHDIRFLGRWRNTEATPDSTATAIRVAGAFASGGAQLQGGRESFELEFEDELLFPVGKRHQMTAGINVEGGQYRGDEWRNSGGTFTFASLDEYAAGLPTTFTQRVGDPSFSYSLFRYGAFIQDDFRIRRNLVLNLGVRNEFQDHLNGSGNIGPRLGFNWTPSPRLKTTLRGGYSVSFQPFQGSTYEQTVLVNGARQRDLVITAPSFPNAFDAGVAAPVLAPGIIRADPDLSTPFNRRLTLGLEQPIRKAARVRVTYSQQTGHDLFRAVDVNAPIDGVRPDAAARNITELRSIAESLNHSLELNLQLTYPHGLSIRTSYVLGRAQNETDGALTLPQNSFDLAQEWGPSRGDIRHRFDASVNSELWFGLRINSILRLQSASPYTITTGLDANGDGVNNEREPGIGRNSARGSGVKNVDATLTWSFGVGQRAARAGQQGRVAAPAANGRTTSPMARFELYLQSSNIFNFVNYQGYSGVETSPFFGVATSASAPRRVSVGARAFF
jgi:outer membrane receptor for ferrienterochelin and colicin